MQIKIFKKKTFLMWSKVRTNTTNFSKYKNTKSQNGAIFSMLSIPKTLRCFLVAEALMGLIYHFPTGENSSFSQKSAMKFKQGPRLGLFSFLFSVCFVLLLITVCLRLTVFDRGLFSLLHGALQVSEKESTKLKVYYTSGY